MANITDQFVTSFSELYFGDKKAVSDLDYTNDTTGARDIRNFFDGTKVAVAATSVAITVDTSNVLVLTAATVAGGVVIKVGDVYFVNNTASDVTIPAVTAGGTARTLDTINALLTFRSALVPLVMEIGSLSNEATVIDTPTFGEVFKGKLRGQLDGGQLDAQLYWAPRDFVHKLMREYAQDGKEIVAGIKWKNNSTTTADSEYVVFDSFVSSFGIDTTFDDVAKASTTLVVDGAEHFAADS